MQYTSCISIQFIQVSIQVSLAWSILLYATFLNTDANTHTLEHTETLSPTIWQETQIYTARKRAAPDPRTWPQHLGHSNVRMRISHIFGFGRFPKTTWNTKFEPPSMLVSHSQLSKRNQISTNCSGFHSQLSWRPRCILWNSPPSWKVRETPSKEAGRTPISGTDGTWINNANQIKGNFVKHGGCGCVVCKCRWRAFMMRIVLRIFVILKRRKSRIKDTFPPAAWATQSGEAPWRRHMSRYQ